MAPWMIAALVSLALVALALAGAAAYRRWTTRRFPRRPPSEVEEPDPLVPGLSSSDWEDEEGRRGA